jgi:hypothetical protein
MSFSDIILPSIKEINGKRVCNACMGELCPYCGGCYNHGECGCNEPPKKKAKARKTKK